MLLKLAIKSLVDRKSSVLLTVISISIGIFMLISFSFIKDQVKYSFTKTVSGLDLIVGAKTSDINLLLYSVFQIGSPANNIDWDQYISLKEDPVVQWTIPISLGDSHKGFRVLGTSDEYFKHYKYGNKKSLSLTNGVWFDDPFDVVLGSEVAQKLKYVEGDLLTLSHGVSRTSFQKHDEAPFKVKGIIKKTGTPVDQSLFVSLAGLEAVHLKWPKNKTEQQQLIDYIKLNGLLPKSITAVYVGLKNKSSTFVLQRKINELQGAGMMAVLPGVALAQVWRMSAIFEKMLMLIGLLVLISTMIGLVTMLVSSLQSRKKELALLRIIGASPLYCFLLIQIESFFMLLFSVFLACFFCWLILFLLDDWLGMNYGLFIDLSDFFTSELLMIIGIVFLTGITLISIPSIMFYKQSILKNLNH